MSWYNLTSLAGLFAFIGVAWLLSENRKNVNFRLVGWGLSLQLLFGFLVFVVIARLPAGLNPFLILNQAVNFVLNSAMAGAEFVFGGLATSDKLGFILAFQSLPMIIFFSALVSILYFCGVMTRVITWFARLFSRSMGISGAESVCAAGNIFLGVESSLSVRPYLGRMTRSELCTVLAAGMATVASNVLAIYIAALRDAFPAIAAHLISASVLSAPAAVVMAKVLTPESERPVTLGYDVRPHYERESNVFEAVINGANAGARLIVGIVALLIAVLGLVALTDQSLGAVGQRLNDVLSLSIDWSLSGLMGYVMYPFTVLMGVPLVDAYEVGKIIGMRTVETEVPAYFRLAQSIADGRIVHGRSTVIAAYALCGFAHVASAAVFIGGVSAIAPNKTKTLSEVAVRALIAATLACLMTACVAGLFYSRGAMLFR